MFDIHKLISLLVGVSSLVCCSKNQFSESAVPTRDLIYFEAPVLSKTGTKAVGSGNNDSRRNVLYSADYPTNWSFAVEARYYEGTPGKTFADLGWDGTTPFINSAKAVYHGGSDDPVPGTASYGGWRTDPACYWIKNRSFAFQACSPHSLLEETYPASTAKQAGLTAEGLCLGSSQTGQTGSKQYYQAKSDGTQVDIMYSDRIIDQRKADVPAGGSYDGIQLNFHHAMSALRFKARTNGRFDSGTLVRLRQVTLLNVLDRGIFVQGLESGGTSYRDGFPAWTEVTGETVGYELLTKDSPGIVLGGGDGYTPPDWYVGEDYNPDVKDIIIIPQAIRGGRFPESEKTTIRVRYEVEVGTSLALTYEKDIFVSDLVFKREDGTQAVSAFEMGKIYTFTIDIGMDIIAFLPVVDQWSDINAFDRE